MRRLALASAIVLVAKAALAQVPPVVDQTSAEQLRDYVDVLSADRAAYQREADRLRLQLIGHERARQDHDAAVDAYWRRYTGLDKATNTDNGDDR